MKRSKTITIGAAAAALFLLAICAVFGFGAEVTFTGDVTYLDQDNLSLVKKFETAYNTVKQRTKIDAYFTGYVFTSRHDIRFGEEGASGEPFKLTSEEGRIKIRRTRTKNYNQTTNTGEKESSPVGVIFLHDAADGHIVDTSQIDLEESFAVEDYPLYWFGPADNKESFDFLRNEFEKSDSIQSDYIFLIGSHIEPEAEKFLFQVGMGDYPSKAREQAIFWLGSNKYDKSLNYLKDIYKKEANSNKMREKVVFSLYLIGNDAAVKELIGIARADSSSKVRQQSIFWLGQKATEASVKALKAVVDDTDEDTEVKESAVFAISQLPKEQSVPMLIKIARSNDNPKVRENAMFWIGQKDDEAALKFFEEILLKKK